MTLLVLVHDKVTYQSRAVLRTFVDPRLQLSADKQYCTVPVPATLITNEWRITMVTNDITVIVSSCRYFTMQLT